MLFYVTSYDNNLNLVENKIMFNNLTAANVLVLLDAVQAR